MNRSGSFRWLPWAGTLLLLGAVPFVHSAPASSTLDMWAPLVSVHVVGQDEELLAIPGTVQAAERSDLAFQFGGVLVERPVVAGQRVTAGTVLARIDPRDFRAHVSLEESRLNLARADYQRFSQLRGTPNSPVSDAEVDRRRSLFEIAEVRYEQARKNLEDATLRAPFDGVIATVLVDNHTQVRARQTVMTIEAADVLEVIIDLPQRVVARVRTVPVDRPIGEVQFAVLPERRYPVTISEIATRADPATQTFRVTLALERPRDVNVLPGMTATVYAQPEVVADAELRIPLAAIVRHESQPDAVWIVDPLSYRIEHRTVTLQEDGSETALVLDGLRPGERIVGAGAARLQAGQVIQPYRTGMLSE